MNDSNFISARTYLAKARESGIDPSAAMQFKINCIISSEAAAVFDSFSFSIFKQNRSYAEAIVRKEHELMPPEEYRLARSRHHLSAKLTFPSFSPQIQPALPRLV
jgi:hypothetical protein